MPAETTYLDINEEQPFMAAFMYLATIVYPENTQKRTKFVNACRAWIIKQKIGSLKRRVIYKEEILAFSEARTIDREFDRAIKIITTRRAIASKIGQLAFMNSAIPVLLQGKKKFSVNAYLEKRYKPDTETGDKYPLDNAYKSRWTPSKPVLHLVMALENVISNNPNLYQSFDDLLIHPEWVKKALISAETCRNYIVNPAIRIKLHIRENKTIQLLAK